MADPVPVALHHLFPRGVDVALGELDGIDLRTPADESALVSDLQRAPVLVSFVWKPEFLTSSLRWVQSISAGVDQFPLDQFRSREIVLTSARGVHAPQMAEHAFALLLAITRRVGISMREAEHRVWKPRMGDELGGRTMGILGMGAIGTEIARRALAWDMSVIGTKAHPEDYEGVPVEVLGPDRTLEVFERADVVVSVLPETDDTRGIIGAEALEALGAGWIVNLGRGSAVDEGALLEALDHGELRGAALDVFEDEPLPQDSVLWSHPRVVITPHLGGLSPAYGPRLARIVADNLDAFRGQGVWRNRVV